MAAYWPPRFANFPVPRWNHGPNAMMHPGPQPKSTEPSEEEEIVPFIPPGANDDPNRPVIPQRMLQCKPYRWRPSKNAWKHIAPSGLRVDPDKEQDPEYRKPPCSQIRIISWNVDMAADEHEERLAAVLRHIEEDVLKCKEGDAPEPCCILLQEVQDGVLPWLLKNGWIRRWFIVTPFTADKWPEEAKYGNVTLVSRSLDIAECHILHYSLSQMQRSCLCVKIRLNIPGTHEKAVISVVNTHLESLVDLRMQRPKQLELATRFLRLQGVQGGVICGDMNAISPEDETIGKDLGLRDSWRKGETDAGNTWGYQGQNSGNYPPNRLDKVFYLPRRGYKVDEPTRIGVGLKIKEDSNEALWVSDHYGLETTLRMRPRSNSSS